MPVQPDLAHHKVTAVHVRVVPVVRVVQDRVAHVQQVQVLVLVQVAIAVHVRRVPVVQAVQAKVVPVAQVVLVLALVPVRELLPVAHHDRTPLVVAATQPVLSVAVVSQARHVSQSAPVVKSSTIWQHQFSVAFRCHWVAVQLCACRAVHRLQTLQTRSVQTRQHS